MLKMKIGDVIEVMDKDGRVYLVKTIRLIEGNYIRGEWISGPKDGKSVVVDFVHEWPVE